MRTAYKLTIFLFQVALTTTVTNAQMKDDGKWEFPDSIPNLCLNYEQNLVATYKSMIERNREWLDPNSKSDKSNFLTLNQSSKKALEEYELSWNRLGCASIIYGSKK